MNLSSQTELLRQRAFLIAPANDVSAVESAVARPFHSVASQLPSSVARARVHFSLALTWRLFEPGARFSSSGHLILRVLTPIHDAGTILADA